MPSLHTLEITDPFDPAPLAEALGEGWTLAEEPAARRRYECADTFDWRLHDEGLGLVLVRVGNQRRWELSGGEGPVLSVPAGHGLPVRLEGLPSGELAEALTGCLPPRALLARAAIDVRVRRWRLLDGERKTVLRLVEEEGHAVAAGPGRVLRHALPRRLLLQPLKGYGDVADRVALLLETGLGGRRVPGCPCDAAYEAAGVVPGDYSSKIRVPLIPELTAAEGTHRICLHLLHTLELNVAGTRADLDPEFLHDLRVAVRRTRSALSQIKGVLPPGRVAPFRDGFGWLGQVTGAKRDLDVFLLQYPDYRDSVPADLREDLEPFRRFLVEQSGRERAVLARRLASPHFHRLVKEWRAFLEAPPDLDAAEKAAAPVRTVADARIWRLFRRIVRAGRAIGETSAPGQLHELRKDCKKLRYLMEFFASLYPAQDLDPLIKALKGLLDILGEHQDLAVQAQHLEAFAERMAAEGTAPARTLLALGALVGGLLERRSAVRAAYAEAFAAFDAPDNRAAYRALFKPAADASS